MWKSITIILISLLFVGCGAYFNQPVKPEKARTGETTPRSKVLENLPAPKEPIVVGVYNFKDQTGQYKSVENGSTFSTAVSQGATTILIKALEDSKWFTPIERENLSNLLNERNIIRSTRDEFAKRENKAQPLLPPLLFAGILLEGGVISYDTNIMTGGLGARYFGVGGSTQYRQDRLTIYLRAVSTSNGKILKTVYVSKTILSQAIDASLFRYVNFQRLLEVETGITKNEPVQLAMKDAIEKAVESLIIEGIQDQLWSSGEGEEVEKELVNAYLDEKKLEESTLLYNRKQYEVDNSNSISVIGKTTLFQSDFSKKPLGYGVGLGYTRRLSDKFGLNLTASYFTLEAGENYSEKFISTDINLEGYILPYDDFSPVVYAGIGGALNPDERYNNSYKIPNQFKVQGGVALDTRISNRLTIRAFAQADYFFNDDIDREVTGKRDDYYLNFGLGLHYFFGNKKSKNVPIEVLEELEEATPTNTDGQ